MEGIQADLIYFNDVISVPVGWSKFKVLGEH